MLQFDVPPPGGKRHK